jgi:hypothetical protein
MASLQPRPGKRTHCHGEHAHNDALGTSDVAKRFGVTPERVRQLERTGVLRASIRTVAGVCIYSAREVEALRQQRAERARAKRR